MRTEWTWRHNRFIAVKDATTDNAEAERKAEQCQAANPGDDVGVVMRQVSDWEPAEWGKPMDGCRHAGAINIVQLPVRPSFNLGVPAEDGRRVGVAEGTCPDCGARVVTVHVHDPAQPWSVQDGHGGTDWHTEWTRWLRPDTEVVLDPSWSPVQGDQAAALAAERAQVAAEVAGYGDLLAEICTCPPPAAGGVAGVNRGHLLGCPELAGGQDGEEAREATPAEIGEWLGRDLGGQRPHGHLGESDQEAGRLPSVGEVLWQVEASRPENYGRTYLEPVDDEDAYRERGLPPSSPACE